MTATIEMTPLAVLAGLLSGDAGVSIASTQPSTSTQGADWWAQKKRKRTVSCGRCTACTREDCGLCLNCTDKPKFGGQGTPAPGRARRCSAGAAPPASSVTPCVCAVFLQIPGLCDGLTAGPPRRAPQASASSRASNASASTRPRPQRSTREAAPSRPCPSRTNLHRSPCASFPSQLTWRRSRPRRAPCRRRSGTTSGAPSSAACACRCVAGCPSRLSLSLPLA